MSKIHTEANSEAYLGAHEFVGPYGLHERDSMRIELVGLVGLIHNGERNSEIQPLEISNLHTHATHTRKRGKNR